MDGIPRTGPLTGVKVVELAGLGPAPFACMTLADMGADVVRVDRPGTAELGTAPPAQDVLNRGKRSVLLDLKRTEAVEAVLTLIAGSDVVVEAYRPGVAERLGVGPDEVFVRNPRLVYARMTGWGQTGPLAPHAGHDINYIAITGALHALGFAGGPPQVPFPILGDYAGGGAYLVTGVLAALLEAHRTGHGQVVDVAMVDGVCHLLAATLSMVASGRWQDERGVNVLDGGSPFYAVYETSDHRFMAVGALESKFFALLLAELQIDPAVFAPRDQYDRARWPALRSLLGEVFAGGTQAHWAGVFARSDACVTPVLSLREAARHPHVAARGSVRDADGLLQPGFAPRFSRHTDAGGAVLLPPKPGQHTREVLGAEGIDVDALIGVRGAGEA